MMNKNNHSMSKRQGIMAALLLAFALMLTQPDKALAQCPCPWGTNGNNISNTNTGNVGIGTNNPAYKLDVIGVGNFHGLGIKNPAGSTQVAVIRSTGQAAFLVAPGVAYSATTPLWAMGLSPDSSAGWSLDSFEGVAYINRIRVLPNGNVGIGTSNPLYKLDVAGTGNFAGPGVGLSVKNTTGWTQVIVGRSTSTGQAAFIAAPSGTNSATNPYWAMGLGSDGSAGWSLETYDGLNMATRIRVLPNGNVGIGTTTPAHRLDIQGGQINTSGGLCIAGDCKTSWSQVGSPWSTSGSNIFYNLGNVGIGTIAPLTKLHVEGDVTVTGNIAAKYQDIAEWVPSRRAMPAGTVVVLDTVQLHHVMASSQAYDTRVAGVISERPGLILGEGGEGKLLVATTGRVRVKVDATRAPIRAGDILVTSDREGIAMRSEPLDLGGAKIHRPGTIIGKALEPLDKGIGEILVLLSLQ